MDLDEKICSGGIPKVDVRNSRFLSVPTVAKICCVNQTAVEEVGLVFKSYFCSDVLTQLDSGDPHTSRGRMDQNTLTK